MDVQQKTVLTLVLWTLMALPLWVGAEEQPQPSTEPSVQAEQARISQPDLDKLPTVTPRSIDVGNDVFTAIELDQFIEKEQKVVGNNKKLIKMAEPVSFEAKMKRQPEEKVMEYIYTALEVAGVTPMPQVHHRMFVESSGGRILPVYVEENAVKKMNAALKEEDKVRFQGYHVYTYAKGPAILVVDFATLP